MRKTIIYITTILLLLAHSRFASAQLFVTPGKTETRNGNKQYKDENYPEAEANYKKALDLKNNMPEATFNLGDALYKQKRYDDAGKQFQLSAQNNPDPNVRAGAWYNMGNSYLEQKKWEEAIKAYKETLKINPKDADAKYNLAYANAMLRKDKGSGKSDKKQDQKDKKDDKQQQDKNNKDGNKDKQQDQKDKQGQKQDKQQGDKDKGQQGQKSKLSKEESERLLQALMNEEQKTTQKMQQKQMKVTRIKIQKDW